MLASLLLYHLIECGARQHVNRVSKTRVNPQDVGHKGTARQRKAANLCLKDP
jgi:hypothetical protein